MSKKGVSATEAMREVLKDWPADKHDAVLHMIEVQTNRLRAAYRQGSAVEFVKAFYVMFDEVMAEKIEGVSCKKGCHFCCRQNVSLHAAEALVIAEYCQKNEIPIPRTYLEEQLKYGWKEVAKTEAGWCTFLRGGQCSIYPVRPLACRKYHVATPPELCDTVKYPSDQGHRVAVAVFTLPEIEASAFYGVMSDHGKSGRLPEMLLPYSK